MQSNSLQHFNGNIQNTTQKNTIPLNRPVPIQDNSPVTIHQTYSITPSRQLIDLNGELVNFDITFHIQSKDKSDFNYRVVDQNFLDNNKSFDYEKSIDGTASGNILATDNKYQNYWIAIVGSRPTDIDITLIKKILPVKVEKSDTSSSSSVNWTYVFIAGLIICGLFFIYNNFNSSFGKEQSKTNMLLKFKNDPLETKIKPLIPKTISHKSTMSLQPPLPQPTVSKPLPQPTVSQPLPQPVMSDSLVDKLNFVF